MSSSKLHKFEHVTFLHETRSNSIQLFNQAWYRDLFAGSFYFTHGLMETFSCFTQSVVLQHKNTNADLGKKLRNLPYGTYITLLELSTYGTLQASVSVKKNKSYLLNLSIVPVPN